MSFSSALFYKISEVKDNCILEKSVLWIVSVGRILVIIVTVALLLTVIDIRSEENSPWRTCSSSPSSRRKGSPSRANEEAAVPCSPCSYGDYKRHF